MGELSRRAENTFSTFASILERESNCRKGEVDPDTDSETGRLRKLLIENIRTLDSMPELNIISLFTENDPLYKMIILLKREEILNARGGIRQAITLRTLPINVVFYILEGAKHEKRENSKSMLPAWRETMMDYFCFIDMKELGALVSSWCNQSHFSPERKRGCRQKLWDLAFRRWSLVRNEMTRTFKREELLETDFSA